MLIRLYVELPGDGPLTFLRWLPEKEEETIVVVDGDVTIKLVLDRKCLADHADKDSFSGQTNVMVSRIRVEVTTDSVSVELVEHIRKGSLSNPDETVRDEYWKLGEKLYKAIVVNINRLIAFSRAAKAQYWLAEIQVEPRAMHSLFSGPDAQVQIEGQWYRWYPSNVIFDTVHFYGGERYLTPEDWIRAGEFVRSGGKPPLVGQLLAGAEQLLDLGHRRTALTEAITALEVIVSEFARSPDANRAFGSVLARRMRCQSLRQQIDHMGFSGTIKYLLPILVPEEKLPTEVIEVVQEAVEQRQNVVHNGQRDVDAAKLRTYLHSIRRLCAILADLSHRS